MPILRYLVLAATCAAIASLAACSGGDPDAANSTASGKATCGGALASAQMHCPPGFVPPSP